MLSGQNSDRVLLLLQQRPVLLPQSFDDLRVAFGPLRDVLLQLSLKPRDSLQQTRLLHQEAVPLHCGFALSLAGLCRKRIYLSFALLSYLQVALLVLNDAAQGVVLLTPREEFLFAPVEGLF